jgi:hypothetical protein
MVQEPLTTIAKDLQTMILLIYKYTCLKNWSKRAVKLLPIPVVCDCHVNTTYKYFHFSTLSSIFQYYIVSNEK